MLIKLQPGDIFDKHYRLLHPLSTEGGTADVWLALDLNTIDDDIKEGEDSFAQAQQADESGLKVAIKIYRPKNALDIEGVQRFRDEFTIVFNCHHSNLLQPTHFNIWQDIPYLVLPFCSNGSSELLIGQLIEPNDIWKYVGDVASGLAYLHANTPPIIHQDIKPANVLIDDKRNYAITDFGISSTQRSHHLYDNTSGTMAYMAPERFVDETPRAESDIYAFGVTLYELLTGQVPFGEDGGMSQPDGKVQLNYYNKKIPTDIKRLIEACLDKDMRRRPTAAQIADAARHKQYPVRHLKRWLLAGSVLAIFAIAFGLAIALRPTPSTVEDDVDVEALYNQALSKANSHNRDSVLQGMNLMENIANKYNYVPALYEVARTYGMVFTKDSATYNPRKRLLNIRMGNRTAEEFCSKHPQYFKGLDYHMYFPMSSDINFKAYNGYSKILRNEEPRYYNEKKHSAFMSACFDLFCNNDPKTAERHFNEAKRYAQLTKDTKFVENIDDYYLKLIKAP